jgi:hypothetical protein
MKEALKIATPLLIALLIATSLTLQAESSIPMMPMTIDGYVIIQRIDGTNITAPAGLKVYAKENTTIINAEDPQNKWITNASGYYMLGASASADNIPIDMWVENINVTRIIFRQATFLTLNLTVVDTTPPTIQILSPQPSGTLPPNQPAWINATITDNLAIDATMITMTLNGTALTPTYNSETGLLYYQTSPLTGGLYIINVSVADLAGNVASEAWSFTVTLPQPPILAITSPTTTNPAYVQSGKKVTVTYTYTEENPSNATIKVYNATHTIASATITSLGGGTNIQRTDNITIPDGTTDGTYSLNVTMFNTYGLSETATQTSAIIVDNTAPTITNVSQNPPKENVQPTDTVEVNATVTDALAGIESVTLLYSTDGGTTWNSVAMQQSGQIYSGAIPEFPYSTVVQYYIEAVDKAGNKEVSPEVEYYTYTVIPEFSNALIILLLLLALTAIATMMKRKKGLLR